MCVRIRRVTKTGLLVMAIVFSIIIVMFAAMMMEHRKTNEENFINNTKTNGEITAVRKTTEKANGRSAGPELFKYDVVDVTYSVYGTDYKNTFEYDGADSGLVGQSIEVAYEEANPQNAYIDVYDSDDILSVITSSQFLQVVFWFILVWFCAWILHILFGDEGWKKLES